MNFDRNKVKNWMYITAEDFTELWDFSEPYLQDQSDEYGEKLLEIFS